MIQKRSINIIYMKLIIFLFAYINSKNIFSFINTIYELTTYEEYKLVKDNIYHYSFNSNYYALIIQCRGAFSIIYYDDLDKIQKRFNGSYSDYIDQKTGWYNAIFDNLRMDSYFIPLSTYYCTFYNKKESYKIDVTNLKKNEYEYEFRNNIGNPYKIEFINLIDNYYLYLQYDNIDFKFYKNNEIDNFGKENEFIKLEKKNNYFIEFTIYDPYSHLYFKLLKNEINEVTFSPINFKVLNGGKFYFYTKKGFEEGGIETSDIFNEPIYCEKIVNIPNIYEVDFKNILKNSFDCRLSNINTLLEYPILEQNSYFIFSLEYEIVKNKIYNKQFSLKLIDKSSNKENEKSSKEEKEKSSKEEKKTETGSGKIGSKVGLSICIILLVIIVLCWIGTIYAGINPKI